MPVPVRIMTVKTNVAITPAQLPLFRGAVIASVVGDSTLFHNHDGDRFRYSYPLVHYRIINGKATLVCINEGIEEFQKLIMGQLLVGDIYIGSTSTRVAFEDVAVREIMLRPIETPVRYHIVRWLPFTPQNYKLWHNIESEEERIAKLESILTGNILSFAKGIGWHIDTQIDLHIDPSTIDRRTTPYKDASVLSFNLSFSVNLLLARDIALGKGVSLNHGIVSIDRDQTE